MTVKLADIEAARRNLVFRLRAWGKGASRGHYE